LALYGVIFNDQPLTEVPRIAKSLNSTIPILYLSEFIEEIRLELDYPTQQVRNILDNIATEDACRIFLREVTFQMAHNAPNSDWR
jgi:hypothetical protein